MMGRARWAGALTAMGCLALAEPVAAITHCEVTGCGSNTPYLFTTPIIGLSLNETRNANGVALVKRLKRVLPAGLGAPDCGTEVFLGIESNGELVGRKADGTIGCRGAAMLGMAFTMSVELNRSVTTTTVRISEASQVLTWELSDASLVPTYRLVWHQVPVGSRLKIGQSICPHREAWMEPWQIASQPPATGDGWRDATDHLLIVQGETYNPDGSIGASGSDWFNIACVGTSIAKMRLLGMDPMNARRPEGEKQRAATLKMLTGRYRGDTSYTSAGMPLMWVRRGSPGREFNGEPAGDTWSRAVVEAYWGAEGAICVSHRRTWKAISSESEIALATPEPRAVVAPRRRPGADRRIPPRVPAGLIPRHTIFPLGLVLYPYEEEPSLAGIRALGIPTCDPPPPPGTYFWITYPVNHVFHSSPTAP